MSNLKVKVTADAAGNVITVSKKNADWGHIRVKQVRMVVDENGFARPHPMSALIIGTIQDLKNYGYKDGQEISGKIIFKESLKPFNNEDPDKDLKVAGETGITCLVGDKPIYRKNFYSDSEDAQDVSLEHTNGDAIKAAHAELKKKKAAEKIDTI